ncbi:hypothetical protein TIFTF001_056724 [Ficus carica]|uniref:Uncharacterized protein n=1 Tax=Ficus carica TaxID=3494 RepID=A0AA88EJ19_FICCA|nr:hypothetical protein TIFTF001_056724 [Ficus carica]
MNKVWKEARAHYAGPIGMNENKFVEVLVLDGCFIIELFRKKAYEYLRDKDDPIFEMSCLLQFLFHDLIMLENQIPWVVLDTLFDLTFMTRIDETPLIQLTTEFFGTIFSTTQPSIDPQPLLSRPRESKHILDMLRNSLLWSYSDLNTANLDWKPMPSVTSLKEAGIEFKSGNSKSILDIKFENGVLEIPSLLIQETTEPLFRNLISLEQCCLSYQPVITSYAMLLDNLINTKDDVEILSQNEVLENWLNVEEATQFFNKLYTDTYVKAYYYLQLTNQVDKYCKRSWPKYRTVLMRDYFKHPWASISFAVATFLVICAFVQTLFTIIK